MAEVTDWSPVDDNNNTAPPVGWPEGMVPSAVNNAARAMQGALKREHDRIVAGTLNLPYLPTAGGVVTGNVAINGTGGLSLGATNLRNISNGLEVYNPSGGSVQSRGPSAAYVFGDRNLGSADWVWFALNNLATLTQAGGGSALTITPAGAVTALASFNAPQYNVGGHVLATYDGSGPNLYDGAGNPALQLYAAQTFYNANAHSFRNDAGVATFNVDPAGNVGVPGTVNAVSAAITGNATVAGTLTASNLTASSTVTAAYVTSTGDVHANGAVTAPTMTATGTIQANYLHSTGTVDGATVAATGNITTPADMGCRDLFCRNIAATGNANITGTCTAANFVGNFAGSGSSTITTGTSTSTTINNSGTVNTANLSASSNVTASGTVTGGSMVCNGTLQVSGAANLLGTLQVGPSGSYMRADAVGTYNVSGSWLTFSDRAVKEGVTAYTAGLAEIEQLLPVSYTYTSAIEDTQVTRYGLVADDVAPVIPEMVGSGVTPGGETMATLAPGHLIWLLVNSCKELSARVQALEAQLAAA